MAFTGVEAGEVMRTGQIPGIFGGGVIFSGLDVGGESQCRIKDMTKFCSEQVRPSQVCSGQFSD